MDHTADVAAIRRVIADIETGLNTNDAVASVAHFTPDATAVSAAGVLTSGRDALLDAHRVALAGPLRDQLARYELGDVRFVADDVAIAHMRATAIDASGEPLDVGHTMIALYVFVRDGARWRVAARQNTLSPSRAAEK